MTSFSITEEQDFDDQEYHQSLARTTTILVGLLWMLGFTEVTNHSHNQTSYFLACVETCPDATPTLLVEAASPAPLVDIFGGKASRRGPDRSGSLS